MSNFSCIPFLLLWLFSCRCHRHYQALVACCGLVLGVETVGLAIMEWHCLIGWKICLMFPFPFPSKTANFNSHPDRPPTIVRKRASGKIRKLVYILRCVPFLPPLNWVETDGRRIRWLQPPCTGNTDKHWLNAESTAIKKSRKPHK